MGLVVALFLSLSLLDCQTRFAFTTKRGKEEDEWMEGERETRPRHQGRYERKERKKKGALFLSSDCLNGLKFTASSKLGDLQNSCRIEAEKSRVFVGVGKGS